MLWFDFHVELVMAREASTAAASGQKKSDNGCFRCRTAGLRPVPLACLSFTSLAQPLLQECVSPTHTIRAARASMGRHFPNFQGEGSSPFRISKKNCRENKDEPATMQSQNTRTNHCVRATPSIAIISECDRRANEHPVKGPALVLRSDVQLNEVIGRIGWILLLQYWREVQLRENRYQRISSFFSLRLGRWMYVHLDARQTT